MKLLKHQVGLPKELLEHEEHLYNSVPKIKARHDLLVDLEKKNIDYNYFLGVVIHHKEAIDNYYEANISAYKCPKCGYVN
jgi:hypothetical protein